MSMDLLNHIEFPVADIETSRRFFEATLAPLGLTLAMSIDPTSSGGGTARHGFGRNGYPSLWIHKRPGDRLPIHIAFTAPDRSTVNAFHDAGLAHGGTDNGPPGVRERYHANYYAAYILDPDGNNIEVVCQTA